MDDATRPSDPAQLRAQGLALRQAAALRTVLDQLAPHLELTAALYTRLTDDAAAVAGLEDLAWHDRITVLGLHELFAAHATLTTLHDLTGAALGL